MPHRDKHTHDEQIVTKPFPECSLSELHAAVNRKKGEPPSLPPADVQAFQQYQDKLTSEVGEHILLKLQAGKDGVAREPRQRAAQGVRRGREGAVGGRAGDACVEGGRRLRGAGSAGSERYLRRYLRDVG